MTVRRLIVIASTWLCGCVFVVTGCHSSDAAVASVSTVATDSSATTETSAATNTPGLYPALIDGGWGYIDNTGTVRIKPESIAGFGCDFSEGVALLEDSENGEVKGWGYIDTHGTVVSAPRFKYADDFSYGLAAVAGDSAEWGYIDKTGTLVIPMKYEVALPFSDGLGAVKGVDGWFFIDKTGVMVLGPYDTAFSFSEGLAYVEGRGVRGFIDKNGGLVSELASGVPESFSDPLSAGFSDGLIPVRSTANTPFLVGYVDKTGAWVIAPRFDYGGDFSEGLAAAADGFGKWGYIDKTGVWVVQPQFGSAGDFSDGRALVHTDGRCGYIDKTGKVVIPMKYAAANDFSGGIAAVWPPYESGYNSPSYINTKGKVIWHGE